MVNHTEESQADQEGFADRWQELQDHPELITCSHEDMNNFFMKIAENGSREYAVILEEMDKVHADCVSIAEQALFSLKRLTLPNQTFFDDIDACIKDVGLDLADIQREISTNRIGKEGMERINTMLLPVYLALRKKGYGHFDLVG